MTEQDFTEDERTYWYKRVRDLEEELAETNAKLMEVYKDFPEYSDDPRLYIEDPDHYDDEVL